MPDIPHPSHRRSKPTAQDLDAGHVNWSEYRPSEELLERRVVLITGASQGIGRALSLACANVGATVVLLGRTVSKLEAVYDEILALNRREPAIYPMDLAGATTADYEELAGRIEDQLGRLDGLVHNAATLGGLSPIEQINPEQWTMVLQTNLTAVFQLTRATLPLLRTSDDASLLFTSAEQGQAGRAYWGAYAVSKFAIEGLTQVVADELENQPNVRVNCIDPGPVRTGLRSSAYPGEVPTSNVMPESIVAPYLYLLGQDGRETHGKRITAQI